MKRIDGARLQGCHREGSRQTGKMGSAALRSHRDNAPVWNGVATSSLPFCIPEGSQRVARGREAHPGLRCERQSTPEELKNTQPSHRLPGCGFHPHAPVPGCVLRTTRGYRLPSLRDVLTPEAGELLANVSTHGRANAVGYPLSTLRAWGGREAGSSDSKLGSSTKRRPRHVRGCDLTIVCNPNARNRW